MTTTAPTRTQIVEQQLGLLNQLLDQVLSGNAFQQARLVDVGFDQHPPTSLEEFTARCPLMTKAELVADQQQNPLYGSNQSRPIEQYTRYHQTSGTTASPVRWLDTDASWQAMIDVWCEVFRAAGVDERDRVMFTFSFGPFIGFWLAFESARQLGALCMPGGGLSSVARLEMIMANRATALCCTPTYAIRLGQVAQEQGIDLGESAVRTIIVGGEPGGSVPATRAAIESLWPNARLVDHHGMTEVGPATYSDPTDPTLLRIVEPQLLAEVIDPTTHQPVEPGRRGELILTTLHRVDCPVLRYRTGDIVEQADVPGRFALRGGIIGRADEMVCVRGVNVFPSAVDQIVRDEPAVAEYRVLVTQSEGLAELILEVEPTDTATDSHQLARRLDERFRTAMSLRVPVKVLKPGSLPQFEMKAKRWVRQ